MHDGVPLGWLGQLLHQQTNQYPPARVRAAMAFLGQLTDKTMTRIGVNDMSIEEFAGQNLTLPEKNAQDAACSVLVEYFLGNLQPDLWEQRTEELRSKQGQSGGVVIRCVGCGGHDNRESCRLCHGTGQLAVYPVYGG